MPESPHIFAAALSLSLFSFTFPLTASSADTGAPVLRGASSERRITFESGRDILIPQLVDGSGWKTTIILMNPSDAPINAIVDFWDDNGAALRLPIAQLQGARYSSLAGTIPPLGSITLDTSDIDSQLSQGYAIAYSEDSTSMLTGMAVFRQRVQGRPDFEAVVPLSPYDEVEFTMPFDNQNGYSTGLAIVNPDVPEAPTSKFTIAFFDSKGNTLLSDSISLPAGVHTAFSLPVRWPALAGKSGILIARSDGRQLSALGLRFSPGGAFTSFHALSLPRPQATSTTPITVPPSLPGVTASCAALAGASIYAQDNAFLGIISNDKYLRDSLANSYGSYGSTYSSSSIFNRYGTYGSDYSSLSPFNQYASQPPLIVQSGKPVAYLTVNTTKTPRVDTNFVLQCVGRTR